MPSSPPEPPTGAPLTVLGSGWTVDRDGALHPTIVLDVDGRPDVSDLPRVHALEGVGDLATSMSRDGDELLLSVSMTTPVRASFSMRLQLPEHAPVLDAAAVANRLVLATTEPEQEGSLWLAIDLDGERLARALAPPPGTEPH